MPAIAVLRVGIRATNRQDPQRVRRRGPSGRKAAEKPRAHGGKGHGPRRREGSLCGAPATKKGQRRRVAQPRSTTRASERPPGKPRAQGGGGNGRRQRAGFLCGATAGKKSQRRRVAKPRASHGLKAVGGLARSRRERWAAEWDSGTASRAPMPASRQPTASRFLGSVVRGFVPLLQLTRCPLRDILLQPCASCCDDIPLGFFHGAGIGGGLAALSDRCCWGASGRAGR